ncbi:hypothetical protein NQ317_017620 [Molorchus minor]|uniref:Uncharacterized protein n=1 Tax=Molorchus minor TaxID=1323400 RepID=A0ABQ9IT39_9CUCU|nr:hypothetical protein NQ317_017620 [Molorchus minor]
MLEGDGLKNSFIDNTELCILCNVLLKDAIFLHSKVAHQCCCYKCAKAYPKVNKRDVPSVTSLDTYARGIECTFFQKKILC